MAEFTLYNAPQSTCSQRVRYAMHATGLEFEERKMDLFSGDQLKPEYLAVNPNGVVPALVHDGAPIIDSTVILDFLEDIHPGAEPLWPPDPKDVARLRAMLRFIDEVPTPAIRVPSYNLAFLPHFQSMSEEEFEALCDSKPLRREFLKKMGRNGFADSEMNDALARLRRGVERMAGWLAESGGPWITGRSISLADLAIMPVIVRMDDIGLNHLWTEHRSIGEWLAHIRATAPFRKTYYEGSLLTEKYPHLADLRQKTVAEATD